MTNSDVRIIKFDWYVENRRKLLDNTIGRNTADVRAV